jgi:hypothetical protein
MKKLIRLTAVAGLVTLLSAVNVWAQEVPGVVKKAFEMKFSKASQVKWSMEEEDEYEVEFMRGGKKMSANFNERGEWLETETALTQRELPRRVRRALSKNFDEMEFKEAWKAESSKETLYEVLLSREEGYEEDHEGDDDEMGYESEREHEEENGEEEDHYEENEEHDHYSELIEVVFRKNGSVVKKHESDEDDEG